MPLLAEKLIGVGSYITSSANNQYHIFIRSAGSYSSEDGQYLLFGLYKSCRHTIPLHRHSKASHINEIQENQRRLL
jgi:hypothetical protein